MKRKSILFLMSVLLCSCHTTRFVPTDNESLSNEFSGRCYAEIVDIMGPPDMVTDDGRGGRILTYRNVTYLTDGTVRRGFGSDNVSMTTREMKNSVNLFLDGEDICRRVTSEGGTYERVFSRGRTVGLCLGVGIPAIIFIISMISAGTR